MGVEREIEPSAAKAADGFSYAKNPFTGLLLTTFNCLTQDTKLSGFVSLVLIEVTYLNPSILRQRKGLLNIY